MSTDDFETRMHAAQVRLAGLTTRLTATEPWPLAERFDHSPEASWGPPEILAHLDEMLAFWLAETERVVASAGGRVPFGRVAEDADRLANIARERTLPMGELLARVSAGIDRWRGRWAELDDSQRALTGLHPTRGEMTVAEIAPRFASEHLEAHLDQLDAALAGEAPSG
jgi:hypothetical protein